MDKSPSSNKFCIPVYLIKYSALFIVLVASGYALFTFITKNSLQSKATYPVYQCIQVAHAVCLKGSTSSCFDASKNLSKKYVNPNLPYNPPGCPADSVCCIPEEYVTPIPNPTPQCFYAGRLVLSTNQNPPSEKLTYVYVPTTIAESIDVTKSKKVLCINSVIKEGLKIIYTQVGAKCITDDTGVIISNGAVYDPIDCPLGGIDNNSSSTSSATSSSSYSSIRSSMSSIMSSSSSSTYSFSYSSSSNHNSSSSLGYSSSSHSSSSRSSASYVPY